MTDITTRARERRLEREMLAIWAAVRPGEPAPLTELEVLHAVENVRRERDALRAEVERLRARKARLCDSCLGWGLARLDGSKEPCPECGRTGAVIVEGEK